ncbi:MAG TPA: response regulator [Opitutaceae bacterium]|nr:response regulator [Opitutaceae bacterium]
MPTLLIIDDNESVRESLKHVFARYGYTVVVADSGENGVVLYAKGGIDAALVDINMPGMNGVEACRLLHAEARGSGREIFVWLMTGAIGSLIEGRALEAGALAVLHKPFNIPEFVRELDRRVKSETRARVECKPTS